MTDERKAELRGLCERATPGPWVHGYTAHGCKPAVMCGNEQTVIARDVRSMAMYNLPRGVTGDAEFIATARTAVPELMHEVEVLTVELAAKIVAYVELERMLAAMTRERDAAVNDCSGCCETCAFVNDCAKHDNNDAAPPTWYWGDCEDWEWRGPVAAEGENNG